MPEADGLFEAIEFPILVIGASNDVVLSNAAARRLTGPDLEHRGDGAQPRALDHEPWRSAAPLLREVRGGGGPRSTQAEGADGRCWEVRVSSVSEGEHRGSLLLLARELTQLVAVQDLLREAEHLAAFGKLAGATAHEVRNPLFAMTASLEVFELDNPVTPALAELFGELRRQVERLVEFTRALTECARPRAMSVASVGFAPLLRTAVASCRWFSDRHGVRVVADVPDGLPLVRVDPHRMVTCLHHVILHAIDASPSGSAIAIDAETAPNENGGWLECRIHQPGSPPVPLAERLEGVDLASIRWTIGFSLAQRLVAAHGGDLTVASAPEGGAVMTIRLPLAREGERSHPSRVEPDDETIDGDLIRTAIAAWSRVGGQALVRAVIRTGGSDVEDLAGRVPLSHYLRLRDAALDFFGQGFQKVAFETGRLLVRNLEGHRSEMVTRLVAEHAHAAQPLEPLRQAIAIAANGNPGQVDTGMDPRGTLRLKIAACPECRGITSSAPFCTLNQGMVSEFAARYLGTTVTTKETRCMACGDESCHFEVTRTDPASGGPPD